MELRRCLLLAPVVAALLIAGGPRPAHAQCEANASSCTDCHEIQGQRPVLDDGRPWHRDHRFGDLCVACHGGDVRATAEDAAHAGRCDPLADPAKTCGGCHTDHAVRAERYLAFAFAATDGAPGAPPHGGTSAGGASASDDASNLVSDGASDDRLASSLESAAAAGGSSGRGGRASAPSPADGRGVDRALAVVAILLGAVLAWQLARRRGGRRGSLIAWLRAPRWSPYVAGAGLGVVVALTEGLLRRPLSASGAFDRLAAYPGRALFPDSTYYAYIMTPAITWQVWLMVGVLAGAFASSRLAHQAHASWLPDAQWIPRFGPSRARRLVIAFVGAALVQIGAGIAGGCTAGLAISGGALLAPAAFVFMAGMFAGGLPAAWWWYRRRS